MKNKPFNILDHAVSPRELADAIIREAKQAMDNPTPDVQKMIDENGKNYATAVLLTRGIRGVGGSHFDITYDGGKKL